MSDISAISSSTSVSQSDAIGSSYSLRDTKSGPSQGVSTMGFDDFLDMVNPLQHIPLVSSIYRAATGTSINPVARIAGDALYGGVFGLASAGISAIGAAADEAVASLTGGQTASGMVVAALFGDDKGAPSSDVQLASNDSSNPAPSSATPAATALPFQTASLLQTPARQSPILDASPLPVPAGQSIPPSATQTAAATIPIQTQAQTSATTGTTTPGQNGLPLDRAKMAYGGVLDPAMMQNAVQNQSLALALMSGKQTLDTQHEIRNSRFSTTTASPITNPTAQSASLPLPGATPSLTSWSPNNDITPQAASNALNPGPAAGLSPAQTAAAQSAALTSALPGALGGAMRNMAQTGQADLKPIKGLDQYRASASRMPAPGASVDVSN
jgi:hypothetical protein